MRGRFLSKTEGLDLNRLNTELTLSMLHIEFWKTYLKKGLRK